MISSSNRAAPDRAIILSVSVNCVVTFAVFPQSTTSVYVSNANAPATDHLVVGGYDVSGEVRSDGEPMKEVTFLLYSATVKREVNQHYLTFLETARRQKKDDFLCDYECKVLEVSTLFDERSLYSCITFVLAVLLHYHAFLYAFITKKLKLGFSIFVICQDVGGCNMSPVEGADSGDGSLAYICSALSREDGTFTFSSLASGEYTVVSFL